MKKFEKSIEVKWADVDQNRHVRHSAYYDYGAFVRVKFITHSGFDAKALGKLKIGPILFKEECSFIKEIHPDDTLRVNMLNGLSNNDGARWIVHHEIFNQHNEKVAHMTAKGAWMDLEKRKLTMPPKELAVAFNSLEVGNDYSYKKSV